MYHDASVCSSIIFYQIAIAWVVVWVQFRSALFGMERGLSLNMVNLNFYTFFMVATMLFFVDCVLFFLAIYHSTTTLLLQQ